MYHPLVAFLSMGAHTIASVLLLLSTVSGRLLTSPSDVARAQDYDFIVVGGELDHILMRQCLLNLSFQLVRLAALSQTVCPSRDQQEFYSLRLAQRQSTYFLLFP